MIVVRNYKLILLMFVVTLASLEASASSFILVRAPTASEESFGAYHEQNHHLKVLSEYEWDPAQLHQLRNQLTSEFEEAQKEFLTGSLQVAQKKYDEVIGMRFKCDWNVSDRRIIYFSFLRLAQLRQNQVEELLRLASEFAPDLTPSVEFFPPPLVQRALQTRQAIIRAASYWKPDFHGAIQIVKIDGRSVFVSRGASVLVSKGRHRVTLLSDVYAPQVFIGTQREVLKLSQENKPAIVSGTCEKPIVADSAVLEKNVMVFFGSDCVKKKVGDGWAPAVIELVPKASSQTPTSVAEGLPEPLNLPPVFASNSGDTSSWKKSPLLWTGIGLAVVGIVYFMLKPKDSDSSQQVVQSGQQQQTTSAPPTQPGPPPPTTVQPTHTGGY